MASLISTRSKPSTAPAAIGRYDTLNGLRGMAALLVVVHHIYALTDVKEPFPSGYLLLDLFFAISGFILAEHYGKRLDDGMTLRDFMARRFNRLYPAYLLGFLVSLPYLRDAKLMSPEIAASSMLGLFMLPDPFTKDLFPTNVAMWTLVYELIVNVAMVLLWRRLSTGVLFALVVLGALTNFYFLLNGGQADVAYTWTTAGMALSMAVMSFFLGVLIQKLPWRPAFLSPWMITILLVAISTLSWSSRWFSIVNLAIGLVVLPVVLLCAVSRKPDRLWHGLFNRLGNASYPLYVLHMPMLILLIKAGLHVGHRPGLMAMMIFLPFLLVISWLTDRYYEPFARKLMREAPAFFWRGPRPVPRLRPSDRS